MLLKYNAITLLTLFLFFPLTDLSAQTTVAKSDGMWSSAANWDNGVPVPGGTVIIDGFDIELDMDATVHQIHLSNTSGDYTRLMLKNNGDVLTVTNDMTISGTDPNQAIHFDIESTDSVYIGNNLTVVRNNSGGPHTHLKVSDNSRLTINGDLIVNYLDGNSSDTHKEVEVKDMAELKVNGNLNLNMSGGEDLTFFAEKTTKTNIAGDVNISVTGGNDFLFYATTGAEVTVAGNFNITNNTFSSDIPTVKLLVDSSSVMNIKNDLNITSGNSDKTAIVVVNGLNTELRLNRHINFVASSEEDAKLSVNYKSKLYLAGNIFPSPINDYGVIRMENTSEIHFNGSSPQNIPGDDIPGNGTDNYLFSNVYFENTADSIVLEYPLTITNSLTLDNGIIKTTDSAPLILDNNVLISGGSRNSYIDGPLTKKGSTNGSSFIFPVGDNGVYAPIEIEEITNSSDEYTAKYIGCPPPLGLINAPLTNVSSLGAWTIERSDPSLLLGNITLHWDNANEVGITDTASLVLAYYTLAAGWKSLGSSNETGNVGTQSGYISNAIGCPPPLGVKMIGFGSENEKENALPVELIGFDAFKNESLTAVTLEWETASEENSDYFIVQKSNDGVNYEKIDQVIAAGNSMEIMSYSSIDNNPNKGNNYYRIMQVDQDGMMTFSRLINVFISIESNNIPLVYPNPIQGQLKIFSKDFKNNEEISILIFDSLGKSIYRNKRRVQDGQLILNTSNLNINRPGIYFLSYIHNGAAYSLEIIKAAQ